MFYPHFLLQTAKSGCQHKNRTAYNRNHLCRFSHTDFYFQTRPLPVFICLLFESVHRYASFFPIHLYTRFFTPAPSHPLNDRLLETFRSLCEHNISDFDLSASDHFCKNTFSRHNALSHLLKNKTPVMTLFSDLRHL